MLAQSKAPIHSHCYWRGIYVCPDPVWPRNHVESARSSRRHREARAVDPPPENCANRPAVYVRHRTATTVAAPRSVQCNPEPHSRCMTSTLPRLMQISRVRLGGSMGSCTRTPGHRPRTALDDPTRRSPAVARGPLPGLHRPDPRPLRHPPRLGHPLHRPTHRRQPAPHRRTADRGPSHHLSAGPLLGRVVGPPPGLPALLGWSWP